MAWGFRRSVTVGGVRFTFSKSGISTSVGGKGFRLTSGPRGIYITTGAGGFYYRQRVGGGSRRPVTPAEPAAPIGYVTTFASSSIDQLTNVTQQEFVESLNDWTSRGVFQLASIFCGIGLVGGLLAAAMPPAIIWEAAAYALLAFGAAYRIEHHRRRFVMLYDLTEDAQQRYDRLCEAIEGVANSGVMRGLKLRAEHGDWKRNAGATGSVQFGGAQIKRASPPYVVTNVSPLCLRTQGKDFYFMPDRLLIRERRRFAALSYDQLAVDVSTGTFIWDESVPAGAEVLGHSWLYVRRDGGPDRRFANNRQIPLIRVAYLSFESESGIRVRLLATAVVRSIEAAGVIRDYVGRRGATQAAPDSELPLEVRQALSALGLPRLLDAKALRDCYIELIKRNHPDRFATSNADLRVLSEARTKEINAAYELLRRLAPAASRDEPIAPSLNERTTPAPAGETDHLERNTLWATATVALLLFLSCRVVAWSQASSTPAKPIAAIGESVATGDAVPREETPTTIPSTSRSRIPRGCAVRAEPVVASKAVGSVLAGASVDIVSRTNGWVQVVTKDGTQGWTGPACWRD